MMNKVMDVVEKAIIIAMIGMAFFVLIAVCIAMMLGNMNVALVMVIVWFFATSILAGSIILVDEIKSIFLEDNA